MLKRNHATGIFEYQLTIRCMHVRPYQLLLLFLLPLLAGAQVTLRLTGLPANTPAAATFYFASNINNWNPADPAFLLTPDANGVPTIVIPQATGTVQYKITRGGWAAVEGGPNGEEIGNRSFTFGGAAQTLNLTVQSWMDLFGSTAAPNVQVLHPAFVMPQLNNRTRRIWLYLPPDYQTSGKRYPVLYMHDGQNLFDARTSFSGEWQVDETLNSLHSNGDYGAIVVGIDNGGGSRLNEYSPWNNPQYGGGEGAAYIDFIAQTLKPHIDANYRTLTGPAHTALFGSSMGALIATYGAVRYPDVFGRVGSFSPAYWFALNELNNYISTSTTPLQELRVYHLAGQNESATVVSNMNNISTRLQNRGVPAAGITSKVDADGAHSEWYWRREFAAAYQWLFANITTSVSNRSTSSPGITVVPNPATATLQLAQYKARAGDVITLRTLQGQTLRQWKGVAQQALYVGDLPAGLYLLQLNAGTTLRVVKR